jgi:hypothetical protein
MGWDLGERREPSAESLERVRAGRNERYSVTPRRYDRATPEEVIDVLARWVRALVDEALEARGR